MIAIDTNLLVYAHRADTPWHARAKAIMQELAEGALPWAIPAPCVSEFLSVVTGFRAPVLPSSTEVAVAQVRGWLRSPLVTVLHSGENHVSELCELAIASKLRGGQFHDARIAAICIENAVQELWTADRDFSRFVGLVVRNPLVAA
jgi:uncharacterized protein